LPVTPVVSGKPVAFVNVPLDGVPNTPPLTNGDPAVPTLTASALATPVPKPEIPVETGKPVALVRVTLVGVPKTGVTSVGLVDKTVLPEPVLVVVPVPPLTTGNAVPESVTANVPDVVMGLPATDKNVGTDIATELTVPLPLAYANEFQAVDPLPILSFDVSVSVPTSPAASVGLAAVHCAAVPFLS
jgi:hypothetical protein